MKPRADLAIDERGVNAIVVGRVIFELRVKAGRQQTEFAKAIGMAQSTLSRLERGQVLPDAEDLRRIASGLGLETAQLVGTIDAAIERTAKEAARRSAHRRSKGKKASPEGWWEPTLLVAGLAGLGALAAYAVASLLNDETKR